MDSRLRTTLVGMGIALGGTLSGCAGQPTFNDEAADDGEFEAEADADTEETDPLLNALCDVSWPPTKGNPDPTTPTCVDPTGECEGAPLPAQCFALVGINTCDRNQKYMDPLRCVDGEWQCPPGSTEGWECVGDECGNTCECWASQSNADSCGITETTTQSVDDLGEAG